MEQKIVAPNADNEPDQAAADGEEQTFTEQLTHDSPTRRADRETQRDFLGARSAAGEQHVPQIQAGDEQDCPSHSHQQRADERDRSVVIWGRANAESRRFVNLQVSRAFCIGRLYGVESLSERRETRLCGVDRETRFQAGGDIERVVSWLRQIVQSFGVGEPGAEARMNPERQPDIGRDERAHPAKSIWSDADYRVRLAIDLEIAPDKIV